MADYAQFIPLLTGTMVYTSIRLARNRNRISPGLLKLAWWIGLTANVLLVCFGAVKNLYGFISYILVAFAFIQNLGEAYADDNKTQQTQTQEVEDHA